MSIAAFPEIIPHGSFGFAGKPAVASDRSVGWLGARIAAGSAGNKETDRADATKVTTGGDLAWSAPTAWSVQLAKVVNRPTLEPRA
jgi:hypothetical protein